MTAIEWHDQLGWREEQVPQCSLSQVSSSIASATLLGTTLNPTSAEIDDSITNTFHRGTCPRIRRAIHRAAAMLAKS